MKKSITLFLFLISFSGIYAQFASSTYGIVRKNYFSNVYSPIDSTFLYEQFDSSSIGIGTVNPTTGYVTSIGGENYNESINLTGAALNPYDSTYIFIGASDMLTLSLTSGEVINRVALNNPVEASYFDNFRFNNSDSTMYGLARRNGVNPITGQFFGEVLLAKANTNTGLITEISQNSVAQGYALAGSAIDPYQMVYYFSTGSNLIGLDIYNGEVYSNPEIVNPNGIAFDNFAYSCADTTIYGLVRKNYFSYVYDPTFPLDSFQVLDSATVRLGKINPNTGVVTIISPYAVIGGGYSLNAGATIDPETMTYYFNNGDNLIGVNVNTGLAVSNTPLTFENGTYFDLMRNFQNCQTAFPKRLSAPLSTKNQIENKLQLYPNPANSLVRITSDQTLNTVLITDISGKVVANLNGNGQNILDIPVSNYSNGIYFITVNGTSNLKFVVQQ
jgi:hypothetical protein